MGNILEPPFDVRFTDKRDEEQTNLPWREWLGQAYNNISSNIQAVSVSDIDDPSTELSFYDAKKSGDILITYESITGDNEATVYTWDSEILTANTPWVVLGKSGSWVAVAGKYTNQSIYLEENQKIQWGTKALLQLTEEGLEIQVANTSGTLVSHGVWRFTDGD